MASLSLRTHYYLVIYSLLICYLGSSWSLCSTAGLPVVALWSSDHTNVMCSYFCCSSIDYVSDASILDVKNYSSESDAAILSYAFNSVVTKNVENTMGTLTILAFFSLTYLQEVADMISSALAEVVQYFGWTRMVLVVDSSDKFYSKVGELAYESLSLKNFSVDYITVPDNFKAAQIVQEVFDHWKIVILSLPSQKAKKVLSSRLLRNLSWPHYAWIVHSVSKDTLLDTEMFEGVIELQVRQIKCMSSTLPRVHYNQLCNNSFSSLTAEVVDFVLWKGNKEIFLSNYTTKDGLGPVTSTRKQPSDAIPQHVPTAFITLYYLGIFLCFVLVTFTLVLYIYFRNEPQIKATSISLSILVFISCYIWIFYLLVLNSTLLPSYHRQTGSTRNFICIFRVWLHGLGYPVALIMCTLLVKLIRVYRIFHYQGRLNKYTCGDMALALYALILTSPNALICLIWSSMDPYLSELIVKVNDGNIFITEQCRSRHTIQWLLGLLIYLVVIAAPLLLMATLTRRIQLENFKDTKKVSILAYMIVLSLAIILSYWFIFRIIGADVVLVHAVLQVGHWGLILQCLLLLFVPKLYPVLKVRIKKICDVPVSK